MTTAKTSGPTWQVIATGVFTVLVSVLGLLYSLQSQRVDRIESVSNGNVEENHDQDKIIVEMRTDLGYVKRSQDDLQQDMHKALDMLNSIQQGAKQ